MDIDGLAGQMNDQHKETQDRLIKLDKTVVRIESTMVNKDACEVHRNKIHDSIRKAGMWNKIATFIAMVAAGAVAYIGFKGGE